MTNGDPYVAPESDVAVKVANTRVRENHERQRAIVHAQTRKQLQVERDGIRAQIHHMAPGVRKVFLAARLEHIKNALKEKSAT